MNKLPILPTTVVGSHAKPGWWHHCKDLVDSGEWGQADLDELLTDAVDIAILDQDRAGLDIITDGESRRLDGYVDGFYGIIKGISALPVQRKAGPWGYDQQTRYEAVGKIEVPDQGLGIVAEFEYLKTHTTKATKVTSPGPLTFGSRIRPNTFYPGPVAVAERFAGVINAELKGLVKAGATFIQIDEPARGNVTGQEMARLFNLATEGVKAKLAFHICFGNRYGRSRFKRDYADYFPGAMDARADQFVLEFAGREMANLSQWKRWNDGRELGAGLVDVKSFYPETPQDVAGRIRAALKVSAPEKLYVNPDCGFVWSPRYIAVAKLKAMVEGAKLARKELTG
ncbi:MAG: methionine synthase [SAR202 cluster bacterium]|nr:methionine synthase [SAR202 cluster bacterium]